MTSVSADARQDLADPPLALLRRPQRARRASPAGSPPGCGGRRSAGRPPRRGPPRARRRAASSAPATVTSRAAAARRRSRAPRGSRSAAPTGTAAPRRRAHPLGPQAHASASGAAVAGALDDTRPHAAAADLLQQVREPRDRRRPGARRRPRARSGARPRCACASARAPRRTASGSHHAASSATTRVSSPISLDAPPITPARASAGSPPRPAITPTRAGSLRSIAVERRQRLALARPAHHQLAPGTRARSNAWLGWPVSIIT